MSQIQVALEKLGCANLQAGSALDPTSVLSKPGELLITFNVNSLITEGFTMGVILLEAGLPNSEARIIGQAISK